MLEYKRDGTLLFLKGNGAIAYYNGIFGFDVKKNVKDWDEFKEFSRNYTRKFVLDGLQKYQTKEQNSNKKNFQILDMGILGPIIEEISTLINDEYLKRFPRWPLKGEQEDFIQVKVDGHTSSNNFKYYWLCRGTILVKDTRYNPPKNGYPYRAEFSGKPEFQFAYFDMEKIRLCNEMAKKDMKKIKLLIDKLEMKIIEQSMKNLLIDFSIGTE